MRKATTAGAIGIVGLGHVGLCTAVCFATSGIETVGVDTDEERVRDISRGKAPFVENRLPLFLSKAIKSGKLQATSDPSALARTGCQFITVQTPSSRDGTIDLGYLRSAAKSVGKVLRENEGYKLVVVKSTVTPKTSVGEVLPVLENISGKKLGEIGLAFNPEFLREGRAIEDTLHPDRLVIGTEEGKSQNALLSLYRRFYGKMPRTILTTVVNAELIKYASNSFLATKVTFINQVANLCSKLPGADVSVVAEGMGLDKRIGPAFLRAGLGYGGSCFPKDVAAFVKAAEDLGVKLGVADAAATGNQRQALVAVELAEDLVGDLRGKRVALLGLAFKPDSDDMREAVSLRLISELVAKGATVVAYDPAAIENAKKVTTHRVEYAKSAKECLKEADCCILVTEWAEFSNLRPRQFEELMRTPTVVDGRRMFDPELFSRSGIKFAAVGLGTQHE